VIVDPVILAGMIFSLVVLVLVGGFILLLPLSQRLGKLLDMWVSEKKGLADRGTDAVAMQNVLTDLSRRLEALEEQQGFLQELVSKRGELPPHLDIEST
jgi:hypothetical protein